MVYLVLYNVTGWSWECLEDWGPFGKTAVVYLVLYNVTGWSWECLEDWGPFGKTAVASMVMTFMFWLCTEVGTFLCGTYNYLCLSL